MRRNCMGSLNVNRKLFKRTSGISFIALLGLLVLLVATGTVFAAAPIAGVGGFMIEADSINGSDFELIPALTSTNTATGNGNIIAQGGLKNQYQRVYPAAQVWLGDVSIEGLNLWKNIDLTAIAAAFGIPDVSYVKVAIGATGTVTGSNLTMNATDIVAGDAAFTNMLMMENLDAQHPNHLTNAQTSAQVNGPYWQIAFQAAKEQGADDAAATAYADSQVTDDAINTGVQIGMQADTMVMTDGAINTHYMKAGAMDIPGMTLALKLYHADDTQILPPFQNKLAPWD